MFRVSFLVYPHVAFCCTTLGLKLVTADGKSITAWGTQVTVLQFVKNISGFHSFWLLRNNLAENCLLVDNANRWAPTLKLMW
jgi:hypothetical protein